MKYLGIIALATMGLGSCMNEHNQIGELVDTQAAISIKEAVKSFETTGKKDFTVFGKVKEVCQAEGCWFSYDLLDGPSIVDFNDEITVPKSLKRRDLYATGSFYKDTLYNDDATDSTDATYELKTKFLAKGVRFK